MTLITKLVRMINRVVERQQQQLQVMVHSEYDRVKLSVEKRTPGNPAVYGYKVYSQNDEDGIIAYIFSKIPSDKVFVEIGCGNGLENNTHALVLSGWRGVWIDGNEKNIEVIRRSVPQNNKLMYDCKFITTTNVATIVGQMIGKINATKIDFFSIDIDSDDVYVLDSFIKVYSPKVLCVEYNAKFPPPMQVRVTPQQTRWDGDDYQGASLASFVAMLEPAGYQLVSCGLSGVNAFFVRTEFAHLFPHYSIDELYQPARFYFWRLASGHPRSLKFLADAVTSNPR